MGAELEKAMRVAVLLDGFGSGMPHSAEERDFLRLRARFQALAPDISERAALKRRLPAPRIELGGQRGWPRALQILSMLVLMVAILVGVPRLIRGVTQDPPDNAGEQITIVNGPTISATPYTGEMLVPQLAPEVCEGQAINDFPKEYQRLRLQGVNGQLLGGGQVESGDFTFEPWLLCGSLFKITGGKQSEIEGLGVALHWSYTGREQDGIITIYAGIEPYIQEINSDISARTGRTTTEIEGIQVPALVLPDWSQAETTLRYVIKAQLPDGSLAGAALNFTLKREADGYRPVNIEVGGLTAGELASPTASQTSQPPFLLLDVDQEYPELADLHMLLEKRAATLLMGKGWIHLVTQKDAGDSQILWPLSENSTGESWFEVDEGGNISALVSTKISTDGRLLQQIAQRDPGSDLLGNFPLQIQSGRYSPGTDLLRRLLDRLRSGQSFTKDLETIDGRQVWVFTTTETADHAFLYMESELVYGSIRREGVDAKTGQYLFDETYYLDGKGNPKLTGRVSYLTEERREVQAEVLALLNQPAVEYTPSTPQGSPATTGKDYSGSALRLVSVQGDDLNRPSFWYGDIFAGDAFLGRVNFGSMPGGWCARSTDGDKLAFRRESTQKAAHLILLDLSDLQPIEAQIMNLQVESKLAWSPVADMLVFTAIDQTTYQRGVYLLDARTTQESNQVRLLGELDSYSPWMPLWKPDGSQVAVVTWDSASLFVVDVERGGVVYEGKFDLASWQPAADAPVRNWGVSVEKMLELGNCFESQQ
jgi:hypothetical protein